MFEITRKSLSYGGRTLTLETGRLARQAGASVLATYGGSSVLATVCAKTELGTQDFFPLTVNYQEKFYAAGRIPGGFFKREGRPTEKETLISRLIDRPIRPLFIEGFKNETQIICTLLSYDKENDGDVLASIAASAALTLSGLPFQGPLGIAKVGYKDGAFILNPSNSQLLESKLDLIVAGTQEGVLMVESEAHELSEETMLEALEFGHQAYQELINFIINFAELAAKDPWPLTDENKDFANSVAGVLEAHRNEIEKAYLIRTKSERVAALKSVKDSIKEKADVAEDQENKLKELIKDLEAQVVRRSIIKTGIRIDGRDNKTVRPIEATAGILPACHGSALFTRGETQALVVTTLGMGTDAQLIDALDGESHEKFMLHYNFPPFSVGETGRMGGPGRREVGHGKLAWRAIRPLLPSFESFPYTLRVVSEILESNGSSSMATVCGTSLSLMDAGVPLPKPIAGIAMGLIKEDDAVVVLSDILGDEDHLGDMDFKVAGTQDGITALQMDLKITSINFSIMKTALSQAKEGRLHILGEMAKGLSSARPELNANAPKITVIKIDKDKIREVIGSGGKVIRDIIEKSKTQIDIEDDGTIRIASNNDADAQHALKLIKNIVAEAEVGEIYDGTVVKIMEFGAFVNFLGAKDGLVHISQISKERVKAVADVLKEGDQVKVKVIGFDRGKVQLSMKEVETSNDVNEPQAS